MELVLMGSGNVAFHLANAFSEQNIPVKQVFGRNKRNLSEIAQLLNTNYSTTEIADADWYLIAVSDDAVSEVSGLITKKNCLVSHTSGSLPKEILRGDYRKSSFYPLQTFSRQKELDYEKIPFFVEAENENDLLFLKEIASSISKNVMESTYEKRKHIHLTAVFACNFVNHLYARAKEISDAQQIPFEYFLPLIDETTEKIHQISPKDAQTGPAVRNDQRVIKLHEELLEGEHLKIYQTMNESIQKMYEL